MELESMGPNPSALESKPKTDTLLLNTRSSDTKMSEDFSGGLLTLVAAAEQVRTQSIPTKELVSSNERTETVNCTGPPSNNSNVLIPPQAEQRQITESSIAVDSRQQYNPHFQNVLQLYTVPLTTTVSHDHPHQQPMSSLPQQQQSQYTYISYIPPPQHTISYNHLYPHHPHFQQPQPLAQTWKPFKAPRGRHKRKQTHDPTTPTTSNTTLEPPRRRSKTLSGLSLIVDALSLSTPPTPSQKPPTRQKHRPNFSPEALKVLTTWLEAHLDNPYPSIIEKEQLAGVTGLKVKQVNDWFINARRRRIVVDERNGGAVRMVGGLMVGHGSLQQQQQQQQEGVQEMQVGEVGQGELVGGTAMHCA
ncbi:Homeobox protein Meis2 [Chytridiales sp. JEL 0842]|nr:Homeobox protein Meis2 [Chytridiales sp. JEL 0842]